MFIAMKKFLNRPALAIAAVLAVIFIIILIKSYVRLLDNLTEPPNVAEQSDGNLLVGSKSSSYAYGPQIPRPLKPTPKSTSEESITLG